MEAFIIGLENLLQPSVLFAIVIGSIGGLAIGAIPGIGPALKNKILLKFKSLKNIKSANIEDLMTVRGINDKIANLIKQNIK